MNIGMDQSHVRKDFSTVTNLCKTQWNVYILRIVSFSLQISLR